MRDQFYCEIKRQVGPFCTTNINDCIISNRITDMDILFILKTLVVSNKSKEKIC